MLKTESKQSTRQTSINEIPPKKHWNTGTFGISRAFAELDEFMHEVQGDITGEDNSARYRELLDKCYDTQEDALFQAAIYDKEVKARIASRKAERARLQALNDIDEKLLLENKGQIRRILDFIGTVKVQVKHFTIAIVRNGGKASVDYIPDLIPEQYVRMRPEPLKDEIEAALKRGEKIPGVIVQDRGTHVQIK